MNYAKRIKEKIQNNQLVVGTNTVFSGASTSAILANAGSEFIWIDMEHGSLDYKDAYEHVLGAHAGGAAALVRVPANDPEMMKKTLDMGVDGVIFPLVRSAAEVRTMVEACLYPPHGCRGWNPLGAARYGKINAVSYYQNGSDSILRFIMLEHVDAYRELDEILQIPGLDGVILGPCDFSGSLGRMLDNSHPEQVAILDDAVRKVCKAGLIAGIALGCRLGGEAYQHWLKAGVRLFSVGQDMDLIYYMVEQKLSELQTAAQEIL